MDIRFLDLKLTMFGYNKFSDKVQVDSSGTGLVCKNLKIYKQPIYLKMSIKL